MKRNSALTLLYGPLCLAMLRPAMAVTIDWSPVGNPGNAPDSVADENGIQHGSVPYSYRIDKYDVTNDQYAEFLNTKDPTGLNALGLWNSGMSDATFGGIIFNNSNAAGSKYTLIAGRENHPVNFVSWYDTIRFANWLNNGQGNGDTETGAYTIKGGTPIPVDPFSITRNPGARVFLPTEDEWYKAAYYDPGTDSYFQYATSDNSTPIASGPTGLANHANYNNVVGNLTNVGAYAGTTSPYSAFDMLGNVYQWNEASFSGSARGVRGSSFDSVSGFLDSSINYASFPTDQLSIVGFRVASVPEPATIMMLALGGVAMLPRNRAYRDVRRLP
jgi:formylglycine-generating enzyme required for sulfatase activity